MKKAILFTLIIITLLLSTAVYAEEALYDEEFEKFIEEDFYDDIGEVELSGSAGITPDSGLYFIESWIEGFLVGNDPEAALRYKEEKILELKEMIESGNEEAAKEALSKVERYNEIIQREVSPSIERKVRESGKAVKELLESFEDQLEGDEWEELREEINNNLKKEDKIALAAKVSKKIQQLCKTLAELDPLEYSKACKTDDDAPKWKKVMDKELTKGQEKEAKAFFGIMSECFDNPRECRCDDITIKPFAEQCNVLAPLAAECEDGNEDACEKMENLEDPIDLLPDYLQEVMEDIENKYGDAKHDLHVPSECVEEGALSREDCMSVMFKTHAPPECQEALEDGRIDPTNENEARKACDKIMFDLEAPSECKEAGLSDHRECERYMFKIDAAPECLDAGLTGSGRDDWKKCEQIMFKLNSPKECIDAGLDGSGREDWKECDAIRFRQDAHPDCLAAGLDGSGRDDWKECNAIQFRLDAHPDCLAAGLDGSGRDDWKKCNVIQFQADSPQECLDAGLTGEGRDDGRKCGAIQFKLDAHPDCLAAGLDGMGRDDWRACQKIQFKAEAPKECLDAGIDGSGRDDWRECDKIRNENEDSGERREDCGHDQLHICDNGFCKCVDEEKSDFDNQHENDDEFSECKDGCNDECPNADRTQCIDNMCECYYDEHDDSDDNNNEPEEDMSDDNSGESNDSGNEDDSNEEVEDNSADEEEEEQEDEPEEEHDDSEEEEEEESNTEE